jgi:hypothetical protein
MVLVVPSWWTIEIQIAGLRGKLSGAVGNYSNIWKAIGKLGLSTT